MNGLTRVRAALEPSAEVEVQIECSRRDPARSACRSRPSTRSTPARRRRPACSRSTIRSTSPSPTCWRTPRHRAFIQSRFDHVLVDEFQDLNGAQLALVDVLSRPHRRLFVVGDDDQLIYGWRQADPRGILEFHRRMPPKPWSATYTLCTNYRCSRAVVETGARLVANNVVREAKDIRPRAGAQDGAVRFFGAPSWPQRAAAVCAFLRAEKARLGCGWRDLAVLCRYRSQQLLVALALDAGDVPRTPALGCTLFTHPAAVLLRAYLDLVRAPDELPGPALAGLLNRPNRYVNAATAEAVAAAAQPWAHLRSSRGPGALRRVRARSPPSSSSSKRSVPGWRRRSSAGRRAGRRAGSGPRRPADPGPRRRSGRGAGHRSSRPAHLRRLRLDGRRGLRARRPLGRGGRRGRGRRRRGLRRRRPARGLRLAPAPGPDLPGPGHVPAHLGPSSRR